MDLAFNAEELAFQKEVRDWITTNMPAEVAEESRRSRTSHVSKERLLQWQKKLAGRGWLCPNWPKEYGGTGWNSTQKFIFEMEMARADSPYLSSFSIKMVAPVLMKYGSDAPGSMGSGVKMRGTEVGQKVTELAVEAVGWYGTPFTELRNYDSNIVPVGGEYVDDVSPRYFNTRKTTIYGGSSEVQRNVLAKAMLGL